MTPNQLLATQFLDGITLVATLGILLTLVRLADNMRILADVVRHLTREVGKCSAIRKADERREDTRKRLPGAMILTDSDMEYSVDRT